MVERSLSMWEVPGSIPGFSSFFLIFYIDPVANFLIVIVGFPFTLYTNLEIAWLVNCLLFSTFSSTASKLCTLNLWVVYHFIIIVLFFWKRASLHNMNQNHFSTHRFMLKCSFCHGDLVMPLSGLIAWKELRTQKSFYHKCSNRTENQKVALAQT